MGDMKQNIKRVAINLFYKKGYYATSMSHIAQGAKIQKASIYHHYPNKEEILVDIFRTTIEDLEKSLESHLKDVRGAENRMCAAIHSHITFHIERQKEAIIADSELRVLTVNNYKTFIRMRDNYERKFQKIIKEGIDIMDQYFVWLYIKIFQSCKILGVYCKFIVNILSKTLKYIY